MCQQLTRPERSKEDSVCGRTIEELNDSTCPLPARSLGGQAQSIDVVTENISATGAYFVADASLNTGDPVKIQLYWQPRGEPEVTFNAMGAVLRVDRLQEKSYGFVIRFAGTPERQQN